MKLVSLQLTNFMPYKGSQRIAFPSDPMKNVMVVFGDNMRGKTSFLNAIRWVFYGRALGRHLSEIPLHMLHNVEAMSEGDSEMEVAIAFEAGGHSYEIRRRSKKRALVATPTRKEDFDVSVGLLRDGMAINAHLIEAEVNKFAPEQVSRFFLFDGELLQEYETLLLEGSEQGKNIKAAIEQVLGVPALVHGRDEAATLLKSAQKQQTKDLAQLAGLERQAEQQGILQAKQTSLETDLSALRQKLDSTKLERTALDDELEQTEAAQRAKYQLDTLVDRRESIATSQRDRQAQKLALLANAWKDLLQPKLRIKLQQLRETQTALTDLLVRRSALENGVRAHKQLVAGADCPMCGQPLGEGRRTEFGTKLGELEGELHRLTVDQSSLTAVSGQIAEIEKLLSTPVAPQVASMEAELRRFEVELTRTENDIERLREEVRGFDDAAVSRKRKLRDQILKNEAALEHDVSLCLASLDKVKKELQIIARTIGTLPQTRAQRSTASVNLLIKLERAFAESIERLRDTLRARVEAMATGAFKDMTTQKAYSKLRINENYGLTILDEKGNPVSLRSAGAEQIVALSLIDGLARAGRAAGPVVMDTPFGRLDTKHRDNILRYLPKTASQLILLVHDGEIRRDEDLQVIADRIGSEYEIREVSPRHSKIEAIAQ